MRRRAGRGRGPALVGPSADARAPPVPHGRRGAPGSPPPPRTLLRHPLPPTPARPRSTHPTLPRTQPGAPAPPRPRLPQGLSCRERRPRLPARALRTRVRAASVWRQQLRFRTGHSLFVETTSPGRPRARPAVWRVRGQMSSWFHSVAEVSRLGGSLKERQAPA